MALPSGTTAVGEPLLYGGDGVKYQSFADAQAGETEDASVTFIAQAGTTEGVVVGTGLSAVDEFYKDYWLINETTVPANSLQAKYVRVSKYVGATQTFTLDEPVNFVSATIRLVKPIRVTLTRDLEGSLTVTKNLELGLAGHRIKGSIDITAGSFCWIKGGDGHITNGIQKTNFGALRIENCSIGRRDDSIYALLMTEGSNTGRTVLRNCHLFGAVAGRRGIAAWEITNCRNDGVSELSPARNTPYRLFESIAGVAVVVTQADWEIDGEWSGAVFYSENSLTGPAAFCAGKMNITTPKTKPQGTDNAGFVFIYMTVGAGINTATWAAFCRLELAVHSQLGLSPMVTAFSFLIDFTGTFDVTASTAAIRMASSVGDINGTRVDGTTMTGTVTLNFGTAQVTCPGGTYTQFRTNSVIAAAVTDSSAPVISQAMTFNPFSSGVTQTNAGAVVIVSGIMTCLLTQTYALAITATAGAWTLSGEQRIRAIVAATTFFSKSGTGGTLIVSNVIRLDLIGSRTSGTFRLAECTATGFTFSSNVLLSGASAPNITLGSGAGCLSSGNITVRGFRFDDAVATNRIARAGSTVSGTIVLEDCHWAGASFTLVDASTGPTSIEFRNCMLSVALSTETGVITWAAATLRFKNCFLNSLFTIVGTPFSTVEGFDTMFNGVSANKSIAGSGVRPTAYRLWNCGYRARIEDLQPEVLKDWEVVPASAALSAGSLQSVNASGKAVPAVAGDNIEGVLLEAVAALDNPAILVRRGRIFVDSEATVVAGNNCVQDGAVPTQQINGVFAGGRRISRAMEAAGATRVGEAYSLVNLE